MINELPGLLEAAHAVAPDLTHVTYHAGSFDYAGRRLQFRGRTIRLGRFTVGDPHVLTLADSWGRIRLDLLVIAPDTAAPVAEYALQTACARGSSLRAQDILSCAVANDGAVRA